MSLPYDIHDCVQCNICFECYSTGERARNCEKICKERLKELNRMNEIKNPLLKELETNAKEFLEYLDNNSERIREIEETLKKLKLFITFWHSKKIIGNYKHKDPIVGDFNTPKYYYQIVAGEKFFYALCKKNKSMEVYDYNGSFVNEFTFDITPSLFAVDEYNKTIYGFANDNKYEPYLLRFSF